MIGLIPQSQSEQYSMNTTYDRTEINRKEAQQQQEEYDRKMAQEHALPEKVSFFTKTTIVFLTVLHDFSTNKNNPNQLHKQVSHSTFPMKMFASIFHVFLINICIHFTN
jgi:hypothetical protein